jgi:hypothetical protein
MRHGYFSDIHGKTQVQAAAKAVGAGTTTGCPFGHTMFSTRQPPRAVGEPSHPAIVGKSAKARSGDLANPPQHDPIEAVFAEIADARSSGVDDPPKDEYDNIPAGYTYFGQLVAHDLTHSVTTAGSAGAPPTLQNLSTPSLDLDTIYGGGPMRCPHLYQPAYLGEPLGSQDGGQYLFYLGRTAKPVFPENAQVKAGLPLDLPRIDTASRGIAKTTPPTSVAPLIQDDRNDDNLIMAQLTTQFLRVHNRIAEFLHRKGDPLNGDRPLTRKDSFELARHFMLKAYRQIVVQDYLRRLLFPSIYKGMLSGTKLEDGLPTDHLPVEFVFGVARAGHAMVRAAYTVNRHIDLKASGLGRLMGISASSPGANLPLPADWVVDWSHLLEMETGDKPQNARRISPFLAPTFVHGDLRSRRTGLKGSLSFHDLWRCYQFSVPTGQECAEQLFGADSSYCLKPEDMLPTPPFIALHPADKLIRALNDHADFRSSTPLSYYVVQEAAFFGGNGSCLGPLGSHIFAKTILHALQVASQPYETPPGHSGLTFSRIANGTGVTQLRDLLKIPELPDEALGAVIVDTLG